MTGGVGADQFYMAASSGNDVMTDFIPGEDLIILTGGLTFEQLTFSQDNTNTLIKLASTQQILAQLLGVNSTQINANNFLLG